MIEKQRIAELNRGAVRQDGAYVLYWMQQSQRARFNHALEYAVEQANAMAKPVVVVFGITQKYPNANVRHYKFMLEGLGKTAKDIERRGAKFVVKLIEPNEAAAQLAKKACMVVTDKSYLKPGRAWRTQAAKEIACRLVEVDTDMVVPMEEASDKEEFSAGTIRPKILRQLDAYLVAVRHAKIKVSANNLMLGPAFDIEDVDKALSKMKIDASAGPVEGFIGGADEAARHLGEFIEHRLGVYAQKRNDPNLNVLSNMSPYLHFGQISALEIALEVMGVKGCTEGKEAYLEELLVRREVAANFCYYNRDYDNYKSVPGWAKVTLEFHKKDKRPNLFTFEQLERGLTYDPYWNAAQWEMVYGGKMHGYMRMYWGKKIIEWTKRPEEAFDIAVRLNDKYELDGRDANGYTGVAWCFGKHDRAWANRAVFGKVRYMNDRGLERKFDAKAYVKKIERMKNELGVI